MLLCLAPALSHSAVQQDSIVFSDGKLSVSLRQASFKDVVKKLSEKSGTNIYIFDDTDNSFITTEFSDRPLESGLRSILKGVDYAIVYQSGLKEGNVKWMNDTTGYGKKSHVRKISGRSQISQSMVRSETSQTRRVSNSNDSRRTTSHMESTSSKRNLIEEDSSEGSEASGSINNIYNNGSYGEAISSDNKAITEESNDIPSWYYEGISDEEAKIRYRIDVLEEQVESGYADKHYESWVKIRGEKIVRHADELVEEYEDRLAELISQ